MQTTSAALLISVSLVIFGIAYYYFTTRHKERMAMLESGASPDLFKWKNQWLYFLLSFGIVCIGSALGVLFGIYLITTLNHIHPVWLMSASLLLFMGISLIACYYIIKSLMTKQRD
ncbi:DUF6249 domain-containing protein [Pedobacter aquatilis]|uniref:DUF6249 domain-containing protein n=1 Tax=Pedobacter aquatilis TaxID=351343 RepID=UPI002931B0CD|nr:DUF6249 domain-containing protein [Pedobacter aquatilis]